MILYIKNILEIVVGYFSCRNISKGDKQMKRKGGFCTKKFLMNEIEEAKEILNNMVVQEGLINLSCKDEILRVSQYIDGLLNRLEKVNN
jgi:hypothetical protein